jgi:hypothetical protein
MQPDGSYQRLVGDDAPSCQQQLVEAAEKRRKTAGKLRKRRPKGFARRSTSDAP